MLTPLQFARQLGPFFFYKDKAFFMPRKKKPVKEFLLRQLYRQGVTFYFSQEDPTETSVSPFYEAATSLRANDCPSFESFSEAFNQNFTNFKFWYLKVTDLKEDLVVSPDLLNEVKKAFPYFPPKRGYIQEGDKIVPLEFKKKNK